MKAKTTMMSICCVFFLFGSTFARDGELPGDANCDGAVNVLDITTMVNYFVGNAPDPFCADNADVNGDGLINIMDVILTVNIFLGDDPGGSTVTDIDGNVYQTVIIGNQEWMAGNLRVTKYNNGGAIPTGLGNTEWGSTTQGAYAVYNNDSNMLQAYGLLYNWYAVTDSRGLCPEGWHVPSNADWSLLINYLASQGFPNENLINGAGNALKSCRQVNSPLGGACDTAEHPRWDDDPWSEENNFGFDEFGFSALPGGFRASIGSYNHLGDHGHWWSSSVDIGAHAWLRAIHNFSGGVYQPSTSMRDGCSVRCVRFVSAP